MIKGKHEKKCEELRERVTQLEYELWTAEHVTTKKHQEIIERRIRDGAVRELVILSENLQKSTNDHAKWCITHGYNAGDLPSAVIINMQMSQRIFSLAEQVAGHKLTVPITLRKEDEG